MSEGTSYLETLNRQIYGMKVLHVPGDVRCDKFGSYCMLNMESSNFLMTYNCTSLSNDNPCSDAFKTQ
jgi:hypothetical protein